MARTSPRGARKAAALERHPVRPGNVYEAPKGRLLIIGGHEDKKHERLILRALAQRANGGKLVVATLASEQPDELWAEYEATFRALGVRHVQHLRVDSRADAQAPRAIAALEQAATIFFTGGDQLRLTATIGDTPVYSRCYEIFAAGGTIAGTSAGASVLSETMLIGGNGESSHRIGDALRLAAGLGFVKDMVIDQHFAERGRITRLLAVVAQNPRILGVGIDEDTAIELDPTRGFRVIGSGGVYVVDGSSVTASNVAEAEPDRTLSILDVRLHLLSQGDEFDWISRQPRILPADRIDNEIAVQTNGTRDAGKGHARASRNGKPRARAR